MDPLVSLAAASAAFVGSHFAMSHPLRAPLVATVGEKPFLGLYSLVALATFASLRLTYHNITAKMVSRDLELSS